MEKMEVRVLVVDDQKMQRIALEYLLKETDKYNVVASLSSAELAVAYVEKNQVDLVVMDVVMTSGISGIDAAEKIKQKHPSVKIVLVTSMPEVSYIKRAEEIGADSLWYKEYEGDPLINVLDRTMEGERVYPDATPSMPLGNASSVELTEGEITVLREVIMGKTDQEIAETLHISVWTVRSHIRDMLQKTGYKNRVELAVKARITGLVID